MAESVLLALTRKGMGRQEAHEHIRQVSMRSRDFFGELRRDETVRKLLTEKELEEAIDFASYTGMAGPTVDRALAKLGYA